jgi:DNA-binding Lrp family transcriptional regulator
MAIAACIFIECSPGKSAQVAAAIRALSGVSLSHAVTGPYDVIVWIEAPDAAALGLFVGSRLHRIPHIRKTTTGIVVQPPA